MFCDLERETAEAARGFHEDVLVTPRHEIVTQPPTPVVARDPPVRARPQACFEPLLSLPLT